MDLSRGPAWPVWCQDAQLNITTNCLDRYQGTPAALRPALIWEGEEGITRSLTYAELNQQVNQTTNALRSLGLGKGDAIGLFMPMIPEIVVALLAIARIGGNHPAVVLWLWPWSHCGAPIRCLCESPVYHRWCFASRQAHPYEIRCGPGREEVTSLQHIIVLNRVGLDVPLQEGRDVWWHDLISHQPIEAKAELTGAEEILMILYTSGTTGQPKGAVHTHCGFPVKAAQDMAFGTDIHPGQVIYWMTDMGWMMGPWLVFGALLLGSTILIYDGAPDYPGPERIWSMVERHHITTLGISPTLSVPSSSSANSLFAGTTCLRCASSPPPARPGIRIPGCGFLIKWASGSARSSITLAGRRFQAAS